MKNTEGVSRFDDDAPSVFQPFSIITIFLNISGR
jgi:hypothetical protein